MNENLIRFYIGAIRKIYHASKEGEGFGPNREKQSKIGPKTALEGGGGSEIVEKSVIYFSNSP